MPANLSLFNFDIPVFTGEKMVIKKDSHSDCLFRIYLNN